MRDNLFALAVQITLDVTKTGPWCFMSRTFVQRLALVLALVFGGEYSAASPDEELRQIASDVQVGRATAHALFTACESHFRSLGFDPRYFVLFWDTARFEVYEGARATLGQDLDSPYVKDLVTQSMPGTPPTGERCERLVREDTPQRRIVPGVSEVDLQRMREVYLSTNPDPHAARDKSLFNDCMKARFNARKLDFDRAFQGCDCTLTAMQSVPSTELDDWLARSHAGAYLPMPQQPWFAALLPKLQACTTQ